jgi:hypothetical protein
MLLREMEINGGFFQIAMSQQDLDGPQIRSVFQQVSRETVPQGLLILLMIYSQRRFAIGVIPSMAWKLKYFAIYVESTMPF